MARISARAAAAADFEAMMAASADERIRFNRAIANGARVILPTAFGPYRVTSVGQDWWYQTDALRSFAGCNDGCWADLLAQAGVARNPRWAKYERCR